jgi:hypothetical protein
MPRNLTRSPIAVKTRLPDGSYEFNAVRDTIKYFTDLKRSPIWGRGIDNTIKEILVKKTPSLKDDDAWKTRITENVIEQALRANKKDGAYSNVINKLNATSQNRQ